jgi:ubiquitin carboxyl-terminal hydrolase 4/11/15
LDGLHEDLNKILEKPIVEDIDIDKEPDQDAAAKFWKNYLKRNSSKIIDLVAGQFKSTLDCPVCGRKSKTFDPFLSISLPIPNYQLIALQLYVVYADSQLVPLKVQLNLSSDLTSKDVIDQLATMLNLEAHQLETVVSKEHKIKEFVKPTSDVKWIHDHEGMCFVHEVERKQQVLAIDEAFILLSYVQKIKGMLSTDDKALSYTRLLVVPRRNTLADLYLRVYNTFRPHFLMCVRQLEERAFPSQLAASYPEVATTDVLIRELDELARLNKLPFLLKY